MRFYEEPHMKDTSSTVTTVILQSVQQSIDYTGEEKNQ